MGHPVVRRVHLRQMATGLINCPPMSKCLDPPLLHMHVLFWFTSFASSLTCCYMNIHCTPHHTSAVIDRVACIHISFW